MGNVFLDVNMIRARISHARKTRAQMDVDDSKNGGVKWVVKSPTDPTPTFCYTSML